MVDAKIVTVIIVLGVNGPLLSKSGKCRCSSINGEFYQQYISVFCLVVFLR